MKILTHNKKLSAEDIAKVEKRLKLTFPQEYKNFLLNYNGGKVGNFCFDFNGESQPCRYFLGIYNTKECDDLVYCKKIFEIEKNLLQILELEYGDGVLINCNEKSKQFGFVYIFFHDNFEGETIKLLCKNLTLFFKMLYVQDFLIDYLNIDESNLTSENEEESQEFLDIIKKQEEKEKLYFHEEELIL